MPATLANNAPPTMHRLQLTSASAIEAAAHSPTSALGLPAALAVATIARRTAGVAASALPSTSIVHICMVNLSSAHSPLPPPQSPTTSSGARPPTIAATATAAVNTIAITNGSGTIRENPRRASRPSRTIGAIRD